MARKRTIKSIQPGEGLSTSELFSRARHQLKELEEAMEARRNRDRACTLLTDAYLTLQDVGRRLEAVGKEFESRPPSGPEDEEDSENDAWDRGPSLAELMGDAESEEEREFAEALNMSVTDVRVMYFRKSLEFFTKGCTQVDEIRNKVISFVRRYRPDLLATLGMSQADVGRKMGQGRATVSAREIRLVEKPMKAAGVKGYKGTGATKSEAHRAKCRDAQKGNTNRADGHRRKALGRAG